MRTETYTETVYDTGDLVEFVGGGPEMTVLEICDDCGDVTCGWFNLDGNDVWTFDVITVPAEVLRPTRVN